MRPNNGHRSSMQSESVYPTDDQFQLLHPGTPQDWHSVAWNIDQGAPGWSQVYHGLSFSDTHNTAWHTTELQPSGLLEPGHPLVTHASAVNPYYATESMLLNALATPAAHNGVLLALPTTIVDGPPTVLTTPLLDNPDPITTTVGADDRRAIMPKPKRPVGTIIGETSMFFDCGGQSFVRLGSMLLQDLGALNNAEDCSYFEGFKAKMTYVIVMHQKPNYRSQQKYCIRSQKRRQVYVSRKEIAEEFASIVRNFIETHPNFHTDRSFQTWPAGSTIENFALVELRKVSRATVKIVLRYIPTSPNI